MFAPNFDWASLRALGRLAFVPHFLRKKEGSSQETWKGAPADRGVAKVGGTLPGTGPVAIPVRGGRGHDEDESGAMDFTPPASIDQSLIHPALRNLDTKYSRNKEDACSDTDSAIDLSFGRSSLESQASPQRTPAKSSEEPCKTADATASAREPISDCCSCPGAPESEQQQPDQVAAPQDQPALETLQKVEADPLTCQAFERRMTIARVVARNKYTHTERRQRDFCWDEEFYTDSTNHLGVIQEALNESHRRAIKTSPTGYRLRTCSWHKLKTPFGKRRLEKADPSLPQIKLTDPEGADWYLEDLRYYPD